MADHDHSYKLLFAHCRMMRDLLEGFVGESWLLIDEGKFEDRELARHSNLVAMLFRLESCRDFDLAAELVGKLIERLNGVGQESLSRAFAVWLNKVMLARLTRGRSNVLDNLWERKSMLSEQMDVWEEEFRQAGRLEGESKLLVRQLRKRFGELPDAVHARLRSADLDQLERWGEQLLDATSLHDLFNVGRVT
jgi:hypothetical protein